MTNRGQVGILDDLQPFKWVFFKEAYAYRQGQTPPILRIDSHVSHLERGRRH